MKDATSITVVLDRSGSMITIAADTIGGFNRFVEDQKAVPGECDLTLVQFDTQDAYEVVYDHQPIATVQPLTAATFTPRAGTPLYDAMGHAIVAAGERLSKMPEADRPKNVVFVVITDGEENSSREYSRGQVMKMVKHQTETYGWHFVYLGANQDALKIGAGVGINAKVAMNYAPQPDAIGAVYAAVSANMRGLRTGLSADLGWTDEQRKKAAGKKSQ